MSSPVDDINAILEKYILPRNDAEHIRLEMQHNYLLSTVYDGRLIYDKELQLKPGSRVLDAGTGAGSWILALAKEVPDSVELVGVDVSLAMFPESFPSNVHLVGASTTNLPDSWTNSFDFIHQRLMICAFTASDWSRAISEIFRALKPGGTAQIVEISAPFPSGENLKMAEKLTTLYTEALRSRAYLYNLADDIPKIMEKAGFVDIREEIRGAPVGNKWGEIGRIGADNFTTAFRLCGSFAVAEGGFGLVKSLEDVDALFKAGRKELDEVEGMCYIPDLPANPLRPLTLASGPTFSQAGGYIPTLLDNPASASTGDQTLRGMPCAVCNTVRVADCAKVCYNFAIILARKPL